MSAKKIILGLLLVSLAGWAWADFMLVYENKEALEKGRFHTGTALNVGVLVPAGLALSSGAQLMVGAVGGDLYKASLLRLDNEIGLAVLKGDERIFDQDLLAAHRKNTEQINRFIPSQSVITSTYSSRGDGVISPAAMGESFLLRINGKIVDTETVVLPVKSKKSKFKLDIIRPKADPAWRIELSLESDPKLSFWNADKQAGLNDVPLSVFKFNHQAMFRPLAEGRFLTVPVEVHFIKQEEYIWTFKVTSKKEKLEQQVKVRFDKEK